MSNEFKELQMKEREPKNPMVFVFGSNEGGIHGAGAARTAQRVYGAEYGCGFGHAGNSFAIPTKDRTIQHTLPLPTILKYVNAFLIYANARIDLEFQVTRIGCGLAGLRDEQIAPMFYLAPANCHFDTVWEKYLPQGTTFWGTF